MQSLEVSIARSLPSSILRLKQSPDSSVQYRMHPEIARFSNEHFYGNEIENAKGLERDRLGPWHNVTAQGVYRVFYHHHLETTPDAGSGYINRKEAELAITLYDALEYIARESRLAGNVDIITPYAAQRELLVRLLERRWAGKEIAQVWSPRGGSRSHLASPASVRSTAFKAKSMTWS